VKIIIDIDKFYLKGKRLTISFGEEKRVYFIKIKGST
jgi:hypothetical protein